MLVLSRWMVVVVSMFRRPFAPYSRLCETMRHKIRSPGIKTDYELLHYGKYANRK
jgi:hypothetical protein